jgi:beta-xylosidase
LKTSDPTQFANGSSQSVIIPDSASWPTNKEHPCIVSQNYGNNQSRYFLFFNSGVGSTQDYKVNYATSTSLMGPYTHKGVLIEKNASRNIYSLGGHSIVRDGNGLRWIVYRAKNTSADGWAGRKPCIETVCL